MRTHGSTLPAVRIEWAQHYMSCVHDSAGRDVVRAEAAMVVIGSFPVSH